MENPLRWLRHMTFPSTYHEVMASPHGVSFLLHDDSFHSHGVSFLLHDVSFHLHGVSFLLHDDSFHLHGVSFCSIIYRASLKTRFYSI